MAQQSFTQTFSTRQRLKTIVGARLNTEWHSTRISPSAHNVCAEYDVRLKLTCFAHMLSISLHTHVRFTNVTFLILIICSHPHIFPFNLFCQTCPLTPIWFWGQLPLNNWHTKPHVYGIGRKPEHQEEYVDSMQMDPEFRVQNGTWVSGAAALCW